MPKGVKTIKGKRRVNPNVKKKSKKTIAKKYTRKSKGGGSPHNSNLNLKTLLPDITEEQIIFIGNFLHKENKTKMHEFIKKIDLKNFEFSHLNDDNLPKIEITEDEFDSKKFFFTAPDIINILKEFSVGEFIQAMSKQNARPANFRPNIITPLPKEILVGGSSQTDSSNHIMIMFMFFIAAILYYKSQSQRQRSFKCFYDNDTNNQRGETRNIIFFLVVSTPHFLPAQFDDAFESLIKDDTGLEDIKEVYKYQLGWREGIAYDGEVQDTKVKCSHNDTPQDFFEHVKKMAKNKNVTHFIFDWDRTLQVIEGMFGFSNIDEKNNYITKWKNEIEGFDKTKPGMSIILDQYLHYYRSSKPSGSLLDLKTLGPLLAKYHAGGEERMKKLKDMFKVIGDKPVTIISSSSAIKTVPDVYKTILEEWGCPNADLHHAKTGEKYRKMGEIGL